jgi:hypothetical protein
MKTEENMLGGEFVHPNASPAAKKAILVGRNMLYGGEEGREGEAIKRAIISGKDLVSGAIPIIAMIVSGIEQMTGDLTDEDVQMVVPHLAGSIVEFAKEEGDPEAMEDDGKPAVAAIIEGATEMLMQGAGQPQEEPQGPPGPPMPDQGPPLMNIPGAPQ